MTQTDYERTPDPAPARLAALEAEAEALPELTSTALRECRTDAYRACVLRRATLPVELAMVRVEAKKLELADLKARVPEAEAEQERCALIAVQTGAERTRIAHELQRANTADALARGESQSALNALGALADDIRRVGAELDALVRAATVQTEAA